LQKVLGATFVTHPVHVYPNDWYVQKKVSKAIR